MLLWSLGYIGLWYYGVPVIYDCVIMEFGLYTTVLLWSSGYIGPCYYGVTIYIYICFEISGCLINCILLSD